MVRNITLSRTQ